MLLVTVDPTHTQTQPHSYRSSLGMVSHLSLPINTQVYSLEKKFAFLPTPPVSLYSFYIYLCVTEVSKEFCQTGLEPFGALAYVPIRRLLLGSNDLHLSSFHIIQSSPCCPSFQHSTLVVDFHLYQCSFTTLLILYIGLNRCDFVFPQNYLFSIYGC